MGLMHQFLLMHTGYENLSSYLTCTAVIGINLITFLFRNSLTKDMEISSTFAISDNQIINSREKSRQVIPYSWFFFEVLKFREWPIFSFSRFCFHECACKSSALQWVVLFFRGVKFHEWSTSAKFAEFTYLEKNQLCGRLAEGKPRVLPPYVLLSWLCGRLAEGKPRVLPPYVLLSCHSIVIQGLRVREWWSMTAQEIQMLWKHKRQWKGL